MVGIMTDCDLRFNTSQVVIWTLAGVGFRLQELVHHYSSGDVI